MNNNEYGIMIISNEIIMYSVLAFQLVMEFCGAGSVTDLVKGENLPPEQLIFTILSAGSLTGSLIVGDVNHAPASRSHWC